MKDDVSQSQAYILFELAGSTYGLPSRDVQHMEMIEHITPVPNALAFVDGVVFSRGMVVPVVNLRVRFGFEREPYTSRTRLVVIRSGDRIVGLVADAAREFRHIPASAIKPPHEAITGAGAKYIAGVATMGDRIILLLDATAVLNFAEGQEIPRATAELAAT
jgi:purine-binding chemotaxis protein CheW